MRRERFADLQLRLDVLPDFPHQPLDRSIRWCNWQANPPRLFPPHGVSVVEERLVEGFGYRLRPPVNRGVAPVARNEHVRLLGIGGEALQLVLKLWDGVSRHHVSSQ